MSQASSRRAGSNYETTAQTFSRLGGPRVNKVLVALEKIGSLGPLIHQYGKENDVDVNRLIAQLLEPIKEAVVRAQIRLETTKAENRGERIQDIETRHAVQKAREGSEKAVLPNVKKAGDKKKVANPQPSGLRANSEPGLWKKPWNEVSGGSFGLGKSRKH